MYMKRCSRCKTWKSKIEFHKNKSKPDGLGSNCKTCVCIIDKSSYVKSESRQISIKERKRKQTAFNVKFMRRYKGLCGCGYCSEKEPVVLDFHHVNSDKLANPSELTSHSTKTLKDEIRKCIVVCANCHRKIHYGILPL